MPDPTKSTATKATSSKAMKEQPLPMLYQDELKILEILDEIFGGDTNYRLRVSRHRLLSKVHL